MFPPQTNGRVHPKFRLECCHCRGRWGELSESGLSVAWGILPQKERHLTIKPFVGNDAHPKTAARSNREEAAHEVAGLNGARGTWARAADHLATQRSQRQL